MEILLISKEAEPNAAAEKIKWHNRRDEAYGLLCLSISRDLLFHLDWLTSPNEVWEKIADLFGKTDEMRGYQIENELISLSPTSFESLQLYFSKFKALVLQLKQCGIEKKDDQLVLAILSKLGPNYSVFVSTFYATKLIARTWKMPSLADFMESLTQEQDKLVMMGTIKPSKDQALIAGDLRVDLKSKKKSKNPPKEKRDKKQSREDLQGPKKNYQKKKNKGEMSKCAYCTKGYHPKSSCMKKQIDMLTQILKKNNISLLDCSNKKEGGWNSEDKEREHALVAGTSNSPSFIIDSGASRHMVSTKEAFSSLDMSKGPSIVLGDDSLTESKGKGRIDLDHGKFSNVLYVPGLASNLLSVY